MVKRNQRNQKQKNNLKTNQKYKNIKNFVEQEKDYHKPGRASNFNSNNYIK